MPLISMLLPQAAAAGQPEVTLEVYATAAPVEGYWLARAGIIIDAELGCPKALGGLMIPNMPFSQ
jgi:hypothetical protein